MRTIKFRAWNPELKKMSKPFSFGQILNFWDTNFKSLEPDKEIVMQFTGLHDKNGKEIYEGDIVLQQTNNGKKPYEVKFDFGCFYAGFHNGSSTKVSPKLIQKNSEVIGNIHENTELLNQN